MINKELERLKKFWKNKKVFLTGHSGFMGSWLIIFLDLLGAQVFGYSSKNYPSSNVYKKCKLSDLIYKSQEGDIRDIKKLKKAIKKFKPDFLFHFAAQSLVRKSYLNPLLTYDINILGTLNVLEVLKELNIVKNALVVTTDKVYDNNNNFKYFKESDVIAGNDPYANSKACADSIVNLYNFSFLKKKNIIVSTARTGNIIGGGDIAENRIIPDYFRALRNNKKLLIRFPNSVRPWQHVIEPLHGYLLLMQKQYDKDSIFYEKNNTWNFGPNNNNNKSVEKIIEILNKFYNYKVKVVKASKKNFYESKILMLNSNKAKENLGWKGTLSIEETIKMIHEWEKNIIFKSNLISLSKKQIVSYLEKYKISPKNY